jgi:hypothetical protein
MHALLPTLSMPDGTGWLLFRGVSGGCSSFGVSAALQDAVGSCTKPSTLLPAPVQQEHSCERILDGACAIGKLHKLPDLNHEPQAC